MDGWDRLPLPTLAVSRIGDSSPRSSSNSERAIPKPKPFSKRISIEETLSQRRGLQETLQSKSSPLLGLGEHVRIPHAASSSSQGQRRPSMSEIPRTLTPTPLHVCLGVVGRQDPWASVLCGRQKINLPHQASQGRVEDLVSWYRRRELENRCSLPSPEARRKLNGSSPQCGWKLPEEGQRSPIFFHSDQGSCPEKLAMPSKIATTYQKMPADLTPKIEDRGWRQVRTVATWVEQARSLAFWRVHQTSRLSQDRDHALQERLKLLDHLERHNVPQGLEALRWGLRARFGDLERAFRYLDVAGDGDGPSLLEMSGSLALLGFDVPSLCGCSDVEVFSALDADRDGRVGLRDLQGAQGPPEQGGSADTKVALLRDGRLRETRGKHISHGTRLLSAVAEDVGTCYTIESAEDAESFDQWALLAKFIALSSWFQTPPDLRQRGRPDFPNHGCSSFRKHQPATPVVSPPGFGDIGHGPATGGGEFKMLRFTKVSGSVTPDGWRLATHREVLASKSDVMMLLDDWDVCGLAGGWRVDGAGYGHNLKGPCGPADFSMIIVCREETQGALPSSPCQQTTTLSELAPQSSQSANSKEITAPPANETVKNRETRSPSSGSTLARQQALDALRQCWLPNEADFEKVEQVLRLHFMKQATVCQFGEPLLNRSDLNKMLGRLPPSGLEEAPFVGDSVSRAALNRHRTATNAEVGDMYDKVLKMQVVLTSLKGRALSKGLTFESVGVLLRKISLSRGLHFRHLVDDAFETHAERAGFEA